MAGKDAPVRSRWQGGRCASPDAKRSWEDGQALAAEVKPSLVAETSQIKVAKRKGEAWLTKCGFHDVGDAFAYAVSALLQGAADEVEVVARFRLRLRKPRAKKV
jgi:hypothetical protein